MFKKAIKTDKAPAAVGPYSAGIKLGDFVYLSGQLPIDPVTNQIVEGGIKEQTHQVLRNTQAVLGAIGLETRHIVKATCYLKDMNDFAAFNEVYASYFEEPYPARVCIEVARLPKDALVEIESLVIDTLVYEQQMANSCGGCNGGCSDEGNCCEGCGE
ncbi:MAG: RidA family protein [Erysipelotrichaceae bacterium]|nr:RidA family protein [Erysipelotrichaceae bacterium]MBQ9986974.1 RidA family protein [Erysipelotrichales bacterium]MBR3693718.1 RidA family protein [Erysipelotrichales bacterium]